MSHTAARPGLSFSPRPGVATRRVAIVGCGTMGRAIAAGGVQAGAIAADRLALTSHSYASAERVAEETGGHALRDNAAACADADVVFLCVKPKDVPSVLAELVAADALAHRPLLVSIAAGVKTEAIEARIGGAGGGATPVVRAMPNTASRIGKGMTVLAKGTSATDEHLAIATEIFSCIGRCLPLDEKHMDTVTAVSASGPAFVYLVIEALSDGGVMCGLPRDVALELVAQMTLGAASMVLESDEHPAMLKDDVTTPAGCTIAGLLALEDGRVRSVFARAVQETARVAGGLGK